jgi:hypothetical protein
MRKRTRDRSWEITALEDAWCYDDAWEYLDGYRDFDAAAAVRERALTAEPWSIEEELDLIATAAVHGNMQGKALPRNLRLRALRGKPRSMWRGRASHYRRYYKLRHKGLQELIDQQED